MRRILVTGASGFIGGHLARTLAERGHDVRCLVRSHSRLERLNNLRIDFAHGDVLQPKSLAAAIDRADVVFHLAGLTCALRDDELFRVNGEGPSMLAACCARRPVPPKLVVVSSVAAAGPVARDAMRRESDPAQPVSQYGRSKLAGEEAVRAWARQVPITIVRPGVVFGPYDPGMRPLMQTLARLGVHLTPGWHSPRLSMIHVDDLVKLLMRTAEDGERLPPSPEAAKPGQGIYFGVSGEHPTYSELGKLLAPALVPWRCAPVICVPSPLAWWLALTNEWIGRLRGRPDIFNRDKIREAIAPSWACSGDKAAEQLQFQPAAPLNSRLLATATWYREHKWA